MADISKITIPNGSGTNTYDLKDSEAREGLLSTVKYTEQTLTSEQQAQARENIGAAASTDIPTDAVKYTAQTLTDAQKTQARTNIGASDGDYRFLTNTPPLVKGSGTGGNLNGGTGMNSTTTTAKKNSIAYGDVASANGNYSAAFGYFLQALHDYEIAYGKFNQSNADTLFSIGDGTSNSDRHNLMELKTDGTLLLNGNAAKVKTDADDYPVLGEICGILPNTSGTASTNPFRYALGINAFFDAETTVTQVTFSTTTTGSPLTYGKYRAGVFGDFLGIRNLSSSTSIDFETNFHSANTTRILVKDCHCMFYLCKKLTTINGISLFDTSNVTDMKDMFYYCSALTTLDLSLFDTRNVITMYRMFQSCTALTNLDISSFDTSKVANMAYMFYGCTALTNLDLSSFDLTNVTDYGKMFNNAGITTLKCPKINPHDDIPLPRTLYSQDGTAYTNLPVTTGTSIELRQSWT